MGHEVGVKSDDSQYDMIQYEPPEPTIRPHLLVSRKPQTIRYIDTV